VGLISKLSIYLVKLRDLIGASNLLEILIVMIKVKRRNSMVNRIVREGPVEYRFIIVDIGFIESIFLDQKIFCSLMRESMTIIVEVTAGKKSWGVGNVIFSFEASLVI